jgi:hypothetical protein
MWTSQAGYEYDLESSPNRVFNPATQTWVETSVVAHAPSREEAERVLAVTYMALVLSLPKP